MPTYEYYCTSCGHAFEMFQSMSAAPVQTCPRPGCGGAVKRKIGGGAGLIFKGSGFYITDYKRAGGSGSSGAGGGSNGGGKSGGAGNSASASE